MQDSELADVVERLSTEPEEDYTLQRVVDQAVVNIPGCDMCSIFVQQRGTVDVGAETDPLAARIDGLQLEFDEGPCLSELRHHEIVSVPRMETEARWPRWSRAVWSEGVRSTLSVRLATYEPYRACLNMYSREVEAFDEDAIDRAIIYSRLASVALLKAREISGLRSALHNRLVIGVAQGILMERYGLSLNRSFEVLRRRSNETNTKLRDVAQEIVDGFPISTPDAVRSSARGKKPTPP